MAHFMGGVSGCRGPASRLGSSGSGVQVYANGWRSGISARMFHNTSDDCDGGSITFNSGSGHGGGMLSLGFDNLDVVIEALAGGDKKVQAITARIHKEFQKLEAEAPVAVKRIDRKNKIEANRREREYKAEMKRKAEVKASITVEERRNFVCLVDGYSPDITADEVNDRIMQPYGNVPTERNEEGHLIYRRGGGWAYEIYNLTTGVIVDSSAEKESPITS